MKIQIREDMMVPMLKDDSTFQWIQVKKDAVYDCISNDCGPVMITLSGIIVPTKKVYTR